jgi:hypothetical protein
MRSEGKARGHALASAAGLLLLALLCAVPARAQTQPTLKKDVKVYVSVMDPKTVGDVFGRRIGDRFVAIQVTITNRRDDFQLLIHDVSLDLRRIFPAGSQYMPPEIKAELDCESALENRRQQYIQELKEKRAEYVRRGAVLDRQETRRLDREVETLEGEIKGLRQDMEMCKGRGQFELSSLELSLLRGVAEKGQGQDRRNFILRLFRGVGTVAAGLIGVAPFGPSYGDSVAIFNGPVISAYMDAFPDYTINQLNRLNDSAYRSNTLVGKQQAKVLVAFIPQPMFMDKKQRELFRSDPIKLFGQIDFRKAEALVDGAFITEVEDMPPLASAIQIEPEEAAKLQDAAPEVRGTIVGRLLSGAKVALTGAVPEGVTIEGEETTDDKRLDFVIKSPKPIPPGTPFTFEVSNAQGVQTITRPLSYTPKLPTLTGVEPDPAEGEAGSEVTLTLKGTNFIPNTGANARATHVVTQPGSGLRVVSVDVTGSTTLDVTLSIGVGARSGPSQLRVSNAAGQSADSVTFTVKAPPEKN